MFPLEVYSLFINDLYIRIRDEVNKKYDSRKHRDRNEYCRYQATKGKNIENVEVVFAKILENLLSGRTAST